MQRRLGHVELGGHVGVAEAVEPPHLHEPLADIEDAGGGVVRLGAVALGRHSRRIILTWVEVDSACHSTY
jgi:hypothetical protein